LPASSSSSNDFEIGSNHFPASVCCKFVTAEQEIRPAM
jgi:hypothetical protein